MMRTRIVDFLRGSFPDASGADHTVEYRLMCSGVLHRRIVGDWTRSDVARILSPGPCELVVCNNHIDEYPQELALRFPVPNVVEQYGNWNFSHRPDQEIASDLAALFTLFCRRLVTVVVKVREIAQGGKEETPAELRDWAVPVHGASVVHWPVRPATVITTPEVVEGEWRVRQEVQSHMPSPVEIDPDIMAHWLTRIAGNGDDLAARLIMAARRYQEAMRFIPENVDLGYQLLISAIETVSNSTRYDPPREKVLEARNALVKYLSSLNLPQEQIDKAVEVDTRQISWSQEKFIGFIEKHLPDTVWDALDPLYPGLEFPDLIPKRDQLREILKRIYRMRSSASHEGRPYPRYVSIGISPSMSVDAIRALRAAAESERIPPITWFERATQATLDRFIDEL